MTTLLIDGLMLVHRSHRGMPDLCAEDGTPTGMEYGFLRSVAALLKRFEVERCVICWDAPGAARQRRKAHPSYKANRPPPTDAERVSLYKRVACLRAEVLDQLFYWAQEPAKEADDLLFSLSRAEGEFLIYTNDADLLQAVDGERVVQVKSHEGKLYGWDEKKVLQKYSVCPHQLPLLRAVLGDPSDNLPGCGVFGKGKTSDYVRDAYRAYEATRGSLPDVLSARVALDLGIVGYWSEKKISAWTLFVSSGLLRLNYEAMLLREERVTVHAPARDEARAIAMLRALNIKSLRFPEDILAAPLCEEEEF